MDDMERQLADLRTQFAVLEEQMETRSEEFRAALERMERRAAERDAEQIRRDKTNLQWVIDFSLALAAVVLGCLGLMFTAAGLFN